MNPENTNNAIAVWVEQLLRRYNRVVASAQSPEPELLQALNTLQLADAVLDKSQLTRSNPDHCKQIAIIGPTQSGKSTLVNILLDCNAASISALAGFTVHAQGYGTSVSEADLHSLEVLMAPMLRTPAKQLNANNLDAFALETVSAGNLAIVDQAVVWDTPDFDSIESGSYKRAVIRTIGLADLLILMVSKDKYGDKSVWDILALLHTLKQPLIVCINKLDKADEQTVLNAFTRRFTERFDAPIPPIVTLAFVHRPASDNRIALPEIQQAQLATALNNAQQQINRQSVEHNIGAFITLHREQWLAPLIAEKQAESEWTLWVDAMISEAEKSYLQGYLNNPDKYDTFNRALAELLTLLEIPGLAPALARTRQIVTWPARKLLGLGRTAINNKLNVLQGSSTTDQVSNQEADTLHGILDTSLIKLQSKLLDQSQEPYWIAMNQAFRENEARIRKEYLTQSELARQAFEPLIDEAAQRLYEQLQAQPTLLNTLRATRATADAAGIALAVKSGGLAPTDLILAPAMFSVTTLLTESALGKYLDSIKRELKEQQRKHINDRVFNRVLGTELYALTKTLDNEGLFSQQIEPELSRVLVENARPTYS